MANFGQKWLCASFLALLTLCPLFAHAQHPVYPLHVSGNHRYLEDASGRPFLVVGDSAWSLIGDLSREDADHYLADRQRRGFNAIIVSLIEHRFSRNAPGNFYGQTPFLEGNDFSKPNDAYFDDAYWILQRAYQRGFLVLLVPSYLGSDGGSEGWFREVKAAGSDAMRAYGRYLGKRFGDLPNIVWVQGGDYDTPDKNLVASLAEGISEITPDVLQTIHRGPNTVGSDAWPSAKWLKIDSLYAYDNVIDQALHHHQKGSTLPYIFLEGPYENERGSDEQSLRTNAYGTILAGACGQVFGNNPVWHFDGPGLYGQTLNWREALASRGAQSMTHLKTFFNGIEWWTLDPAPSTLLTPQNQAFAGFAIGSRSPNGALAVIYLSDRSSVFVDMTALPPTTNQIRWFDPSSGQYVKTIKRKAHQQGTIKLEPPHGQNSAGFGDWLLVLTGGG